MRIPQASESLHTPLAAEYFYCQIKCNGIILVLCFLLERVQLKKDDHPLAIRILHGPCEQISKIFLMEPDQVEEVTYDVRYSDLLVHAVDRVSVRNRTHGHTCYYTCSFEVFQNVV